MLLGRLLVGAGLAVVACHSSFPSPGTAEVAALRTKDPDARLANLEHGRSLYLGKCGGCHLLIEPSKFGPDVWPTKVERMQSERRVLLTSEELTDLKRYLVAVSAVDRERAL